MNSVKMELSGNAFGPGAGPESLDLARRATISRRLSSKAGGGWARGDPTARIADWLGVRLDVAAEASAKFSAAGAIEHSEKLGFENRVPASGGGVDQIVGERNFRLLRLGVDILVGSRQPSSGAEF